MARALFLPHLQAIVHCRVQEVPELVPVLMVDEPIHKDSAAFMIPHPHDLLLLRMHLGVCQIDALEDLCNVAQVEKVMALLWRWQEAINDLSVDVDGGHCQRLGEGFDLIAREVIQLVASAQALLLDTCRATRQSHENALDLAISWIDLVRCAVDFKHPCMKR